MISLAACFLSALALSLALTPICRSLAHRAGLVTRPGVDRWARRPTAVAGGVAIVGTVLVLTLGTGAWRELWQLMLAGALIAGVGFADDLVSLKASTKLVAQITVASL